MFASLVPVQLLGCKVVGVTTSLPVGSDSVEVLRLRRRRRQVVVRQIRLRQVVRQIRLRQIRLRQIHLRQIRLRLGLRQGVVHQMVVE